MAVDIVFVMLKIVGLILTTGLGTYAIFKNFRDNDTGRVTRHGRVAFTIIIVSGIVAATAELVQTIKDKAAKEAARIESDVLHKNVRDTLSASNEASQRSEELLFQMNRSLHLLTTPEISLGVQIPVDFPEFEAYRKRLSVRVAELTDRYKRGEELGHLLAIGAYAAEIDVDGSVTRWGIMQPSSYLPSWYEDKERFALEILRSSYIIDIYTTPIEPEAYKFASNNAGVGSAIHIQVFEVMHSKSKLRLFYPVSDNMAPPATISLEASDLTPTTWKSAANVISLADLRGAQVFIRRAVDKKELREPHNRLLQETKLLWLHLSFAGKYRIRFSPKNWREYSTPVREDFYETVPGSPYYVANLPAKLEDLLQYTATQ